MSFADKIVTAELAQVHINQWKSFGKTVVFTNGCFDILHLGHVTYLEKARELGDVLVVGVNSDLSVQRLKGANRPIKDQESRIAILAGLEAVSLVVVFEEDSPLQLIKSLNPDILVKGGDYNVKDIVGADFVLSGGGSVKTIEFVNGFSSTSIINKMTQIGRP